MTDFTADQLLEMADKANKVGNVDAAKHFYGEYQKAANASAGIGMAAKAAGAKPIDGGGGAAFGVYPKQRATQSNGDNTNIVAGGLASAVTAPAQALAGIADAGVMAGRWAGKKLGVDVGPDPEMMGPAVSNLADALAGYQIPHSVPRAAFEGAITAPIGAGNKVAQMIAGAAAGGTSKAAADASAPWYAQILASLLAGKAGGSVANAAGLAKAELLAKPGIQRAAEGLSPEDWKAAQAAQTAAAPRTNLFPSQALQVPAEGFQALQAALLGTKASGGPAIRQQLRDQPQAVAGIIDELRNASGQRPGSSDLLAAKIQELAKTGLKSEGDAVNAATKPLYNAPDALAVLQPTARANISSQLDNVFTAKANQYRATGGAVGALEEARQRVQQILQHPNGAVRLDEVQNAISDAKAGLKAYTDLAPSQANRARQAVSEALAPLQAEIDRLAPSLQQARTMQKDLRTNLSGSFNDAFRQAKAGGGAEGALNAAESRPELVASLAKQNPKVAQELLQRQLDNAIEAVTAPDALTKLPRGQEGTRLQAALTQGLKGKAFDTNLEYLFPGRPQAAEGWRALLDTAANASKPVTAAAVPAGSALPQEIARGLVGGLAVKAAAATRVLGGGMLKNLRDNATISILQSPDFLARLEKLANIPKPQLTPALIAATFPELVRGQNGP